jgi:hypothetical protein
LRPLLVLRLDPASLSALPYDVKEVCAKNQYKAANSTANDN